MCIIECVCDIKHMHLAPLSPEIKPITLKVQKFLKISKDEEDERGNNGRWEPSQSFRRTRKATELRPPTPNRDWAWSRGAARQWVRTPERQEPRWQVHTAPLALCPSAEFQEHWQLPQKTGRFFLAHTEQLNDFPTTSTSPTQLGYREAHHP